MRTCESGGGIRVVSLNLGGRNTNPVEFELKGDNSATSMEAMSVLRQARKAMRDVKEGPVSMLPLEVELIDQILLAIYGEAKAGSYHYIRDLFRSETWEVVLKKIRVQHPHLFNALNLSTLKLKRPSVWEDPASCSQFISRLDYLHAWKQWYLQLDRSSKFWLEDAPRAAKKRNMDTASAFAGLLVFDAMSLCTATRALSSTWNRAVSGGDSSVCLPFKELARFATQLPASNLAARHEVARSFIEGAQAIFAQEARDFAGHSAIADCFLPPFCARDGFTAVFLGRDAFKEATDIKEDVIGRMEKLMDAEQQAECGWGTAAKRLAAVSCRCRTQLGSASVCMVSLHCSQTGRTASLIETLREALQDFDADLHVVGMDSNCSPQDAVGFQSQLWSSGFEIGCVPKQNQVTVAKQRTCFHTQVQKIGVTDISHKDYIVSWGSTKLQRGQTRYTPDLRTAYGVEQETKQCVRLPTTRWPFDHCGVETSFRLTSKLQESSCVSPRVALSCIVAGLTLLSLALPLASPAERGSPYGEPGSWHRESWVGTPRTGICEAPSPCTEQWVPDGEGACYMATPQMGYWEAEMHCREAQGLMVEVGSEAENQFVTNRICPRGEFCWIGLRSDVRGEEHWWASGEPVRYSRLEGIEMLWPLFPKSTREDLRAVVLSNLPGKISGCRNDYAIPLLEVPKSIFLLNWLGPYVALLVTAVVLLLPRPPQPWTTMYLLLAFATNMSVVLTKTGDICFASSVEAHQSAYLLYSISDTGGHTVTSLLSFYMIIERMRVLGPQRSLSIVFYAMMGLIGSSVLFNLFAIDVTTTFDVSSTWVQIYFAKQGVFAILYLVALAMVGYNLYRTWACLQREATTGRSSQGGSDLASEVRTARLHFLSVVTALTTSVVRWFSMIAMVPLWTTTNLTETWWPLTFWHLATILDSVTNDACVHLLAVMNMDNAVVRARGITKEVFECACQEVEQHHIAVRVLKAAGTSAEQSRQLASLESEARAAYEADNKNSRPFAMFQSAVWAETVRVHWLMQCVRLRAMTMPVRYRYLMEIPILEGSPRQHVPACMLGTECSGEGSDYFAWLYTEADGAQQVLFQQLKQLLSKFNSSLSPADLGLAREEFPWMTWASSPEGVGSKRQLLKGEVVSPGDILIHRPAGSHHRCCRHLGKSASSSCFVLEETSLSKVRIHRSGAESAESVPREELRVCAGGGVFIPGPKKSKQRCFDKIEADYAGRVPEPAAASLADVCRCMIVLDDPYAMAVLVAYLRSTMRVVRLKNRFADDVLEHPTPEELLSMFNSFSDHSRYETKADYSSGTSSMYRDISMNVEVTTPSGVPFICEIQVTLSNLAILKSADQKLYTARRMKSPQELRATHVFTGEAGAEATMATT